MGPGVANARQTSSPSRQTPDHSPIDPLTLEEQIRTRAHEIWLERGAQDGSAEGIWLEAEKEILQSIQK